MKRIASPQTAQYIYPTYQPPEAKKLPAPHRHPPPPVTLFPFNETCLARPNAPCVAPVSDPFVNLGDDRDGNEDVRGFWEGMGVYGLKLEREEFGGESGERGEG